MFKIFLVEDESVVREGIKNNIQWEKEGFTVVGDESDGELAFPLILKEQPDILITDIKMPFMDGLELSRLVKSELPQIKIIIISGYSDFSYAQKAIDIGISEYILKPVTSSKVIEAVKSAAASIEKQRSDQALMDQYQMLLYQKQSEKRRDFFEALVSGKLSLSNILEQEKELGLQMVARCFCVILFQFQEQSEQLVYSDSLVRCEQKLQEVLRDYLEIVTFDRGMDGWAFILMGDNEKKVAGLIDQLRERLMTVISGNITYYGGIGTIVNRIRDLQQSFVFANKAFALRYFEKGNQFFTIDDVNKLHETMTDQMHISEMNLDKLDRSRVVEFLKRGAIHDVDEFVSHYFEGLDADALNSVLFRQYIMMDGYSAVMKFLMHLEYTKENIDSRLKTVQELSSELNAVEDCRRLYKSLLTEAIELRNAKSQKKYSEMIEAAKLFIQASFNQSDLTLNRVAAHVDMSPNYFSSLFTQEIGVTFIEYLTEIRMKKAKEYLRCTHKKIIEIGYLVGYLDSHYFSFIFKKTQNCTPSDYRTAGKCVE